MAGSLLESMGIVIFLQCKTSGGNYGQNQDRGAFCLLGNSAASSQDSYIGCRLQKLP